MLCATSRRSPEAQGLLIACDGAGILMRDDPIRIAMARHASIELSDTPGAGSLTSLWQSDQLALRFRTILTDRRPARCVGLDVRGYAMSDDAARPPNDDNTRIKFNPSARLKMICGDLGEKHWPIRARDPRRRCTAPLERQIRELHRARAGARVGEILRHVAARRLYKAGASVPHAATGSGSRRSIAAARVLASQRLGSSPCAADEATERILVMPLDDRPLTDADFIMFITDLGTRTNTMVRERIEAAVAPLEARIVELELMVRKGSDGRDGKRIA